MSEYKDVLDDVVKEDAAEQQDTDFEEEEVREQETEQDDSSDTNTGHDDGGSLNDRVSNSIGRGAVENIIKQSVYQKYDIDAKAMKEFSRLSPTEMISDFKGSISELHTLRSDYAQGKYTKEEYKILSSKVKGEISGKMLEMGSSRKSILEDVLLRSFGVDPKDINEARTFSDLVDAFRGDIDPTPDYDPEVVAEADGDDALGVEMPELEVDTDADTEAELQQESDIENEALAEKDAERIGTLTRKQRKIPISRRNRRRARATLSVMVKLIIKKNLKLKRRNRIMKQKAKHCRRTSRTFPRNCRMIRMNPMPKTQLRMRMTMRTRRPILKNRKM